MQRVVQAKGQRAYNRERMRTRRLASFAGVVCSGLLIAATGDAASDDKRVEQAHGYHILVRPARTGETPPEAKQPQPNDSVQRRRGSDTEIGNQTAPTREPELKPKEIKP